MPASSVDCNLTVICFHLMFPLQIRRLLSSRDSSGDEDENDDADDDDNGDDDNNNNNDDDDLLALNVHHVFRQMDMLCRFENGDLAWKEIARYQLIVYIYCEPIKAAPIIY